MKNNNFNIKNFRNETLKTTTKEFANRLGISEETIIHYEENPQDVPMGIMLKISEEFGITMQQMLNYEPRQNSPFNIKNSWIKIENFKHYINLYLDENKNISACKRYSRVLDSIKNSTNKLTAKPTVVILGRSDSGKSTMTNNLIGVDKLPADWQPMTSIIVYIKHIDDRPDYMNDDTVCVFKNDDNNQPWDDSRLTDEEYTKSLIVASGDESLLATYGTHVGERNNTYESQINPISAAVLFVDSPILKCCDIVDVPGFTGGKPSDEKAAEFACGKADILIYLSQANSFMCKEDFVYLKGAINNLPVIDDVNNPDIPKLANLFVVATQSHIIDYGNEEKISRILSNGCDRFYNTLTENFWDNKEQISGHSYQKEDLQKRFFSYTTDIKRLCTQFEDSLRATLETFPDAVEDKIIKAIKSQKDALCLELAEELKEKYALRDEKAAIESEYQARINNESRIKQEFEEKRKGVLNTINNSRSSSKSAFSNRFNKIFTESTLVDMMKNRSIKNKKSSKEEFVAYLSSKMDEECTNAVMTEAEKLKSTFDQYTDACQKIFNSTNIKTSKISDDCIMRYDAKRAFVSGLSGAAAYGALAVWASTLGNLGGYIIATKAVSLLATLGIHIGGTAAAVSTVSALGGPVAWGIGIAVLIGSVVFGLLSGGWRKQFAKSILKELEENGTFSEYLKAIDKNWDDTEKAFNLGAANVVIEWDKHTSELKETIDNYNIEEIENAIHSIETTMTVVENVPILGENIMVYNI